jgi:hypothetical protein
LKKLFFLTVSSILFFSISAWAVKRPIRKEASCQAYLLGEDVAKTPGPVLGVLTQLRQNYEDLHVFVSWGQASGTNLGMRNLQAGSYQINQTSLPKIPKPDKPSHFIFTVAIKGHSKEFNHKASSEVFVSSQFELISELSSKGNLIYRLEAIVDVEDSEHKLFLYLTALNMVPYLTALEFKMKLEPTNLADSQVFDNFRELLKQTVVPQKLSFALAPPSIKYLLKRHPFLHFLVIDALIYKDDKVVSNRTSLEDANRAVITYKLFLRKRPVLH